MRIRRGDDGFTLVEMLVVLIVIGLAAAIGTAVVSERSQRSALLADTTAVGKALEVFDAGHPDVEPESTRVFTTDGSYVLLAGKGQAPQTLAPVTAGPQVDVLGPVALPGATPAWCLTLGAGKLKDRYLPGSGADVGGGCPAPAKG